MKRYTDYEVAIQKLKFKELLGKADLVRIGEVIFNYMTKTGGYHHHNLIKRYLRLYGSVESSMYFRRPDGGYQMYGDYFIAKVLSAYMYKQGREIEIL